ncbi:MAG: GNAT family N-acetyltransferase [Fimbriimonas sp.]
MTKIRPAVWPADASRIVALDTGFQTDRVFRPVQEEFAFRLKEEVLELPLEKRYPVDLTERDRWDLALVAERNGEVVGFLAAEFAEWNRRVVLWHLYVSPTARGGGVGAALLRAVTDFALSRRAHCVWVETQDVNYPAIRFYRKQGFQFVGFDASLYDPEAMEGPETALYFSLPLDRATGVS